MPTLFPPSLAKALAHHRRGEWEPAERIYEAILAHQPEDAEALHLLGVLALQRGRPAEAIERIGRAIARHPNAAVFHGNLGEAYRACGQAQRAAACYEVALRLDPATPGAAVNFGSLLMKEGRPTEALPLFQQALQHWPNSALAHNGLGNAWRLLGDREQAMSHFRRAAELNPQLAAAHTNLGQLLLESGRDEEALAPCQEAVRLQSDSAAAHNNLGNVYRVLGQLPQARSCYTVALRLAPDMAVIPNNLGQVLMEEGEPEAAVRWLEQAVQLDPNTAGYRVNLALALIERRDFEAAETHVQIVLRGDPQHLDAHCARGKLLSEQGRLEEACEEYRGLLEAYPDHPTLHYLLGQLLLELDEPDEALRCFRAALRSDARFAPALSRLAILLRAQMPEEEESALHTLADDPQVSDGDRSLSRFGLAHVCDGRGEYAQAARHLEQANALELACRRRRGQGHNPEAHAHFVDRMLEVFTREFLDRVRGFGVESERPLFIIGLPRSGTSLLEQVLATHSRVFGAGELRLARETFEQLGLELGGFRESRALEELSRIDAATVQRLACRHLNQLDALNAESERVIDKLPDNYMYLGFLSVLFPQARFLHCRRDPRDVALSCWMTQFQQIDWANDPDHLVSRFTQYQRLMEHWRRVQPAAVLDVDYEDMVADLEGTARRVLEFCGLDWQPACLDFHRTRRPVRTASVTQVRQPIYRHSVGRWRHYAAALQSLFARVAATCNQPDERPAEISV